MFILGTAQNADLSSAKVAKNLPKTPKSTWNMIGMQKSGNAWVLELWRHSFACCVYEKIVKWHEWQKNYHAVHKFQQIRTNLSRYSILRWKCIKYDYLNVFFFTLLGWAFNRHLLYNRRPVAFKTWCGHHYGVDWIWPPGWDRVKAAAKIGQVPTSPCPQGELTLTRWNKLYNLINAHTILILSMEQF